MSIARAPNLVDRWVCGSKILDPAFEQRVNLGVFVGVFGLHALALLAFVPWFFSWSGVALALAGVYVFGTLGINIGFHRLLTHRGFTCPRWLEHTLAVIGVWCWQGSPMSWVTAHRIHHQHSDESTDPHTPTQGFFWSHMGWFLTWDSGIYNLNTYDRYVRDLYGQRFYRWLERRRVWLQLQMVPWVVFTLAGGLAGYLSTGTSAGTLQLAASWLIWGVIVRTVLVWHITWSINSITHLWGYRNFSTRDDSRNNWLIGVISNGEGWHNNHHAAPRSAAHGMRWFELDVAYMTIVLLSWLGLAKNIVLPTRHGVPEIEEEPAY